MKKALMILCLSLITTLIYGQGDSSKRLANNGAIQYTRGGFFRSGKFSVDGKELTRNEVDARLMSYPPSANEFKEYKKDRNKTVYTGSAAILFLVASLVANGNIHSQSFNNTTSKVFAGIGVGLIIPETIFAFIGKKHYRHSFELYNQQFR